MIQWEYNNVIVDGGFRDSIGALDTAGGDGWEVVAVEVDEYFGKTIFLVKRLLKAQQGVASKTPSIHHNHSVRFQCGSGCLHRGTEYEITSVTY